MDYKSVIQAYAIGLEAVKDWQVTMDNDGGYWQYTGDLTVECDQCEECMECKYIEAHRQMLNKQFGSPNGYGDIVDVLQAAGVNADWC